MSVSILNNRTLDFLDDINAKYATLECEIEQKLAAICIDEKKFEKTYSVKRVTFEDKLNKTCTDLESAKRRNTELIKELEIAKARLRSRAMYSPLEQVLKKAIDNYVNNSHLPQSTIRKKYGPTTIPANILLFLTSFVTILRYVKKKFDLLTNEVKHTYMS